MDTERLDNYAIRGVSSDKEELHRILKGVPSAFHPKTIGAFCQGIALPEGISLRGKKPIFFQHADGAGSKPILAYLWWRESGHLDGFRAVAEDALVMNTDDLLAVGIVEGFSFSSIISRNKKRIPSEILQAIMESTHDFVEKLNNWGIRAQMSGGETADVGDTVSTVLVDATACAFALPEEIIHPNRIKSGDFIVGFASYGQASYEKFPNSGLGSNGVTSARHDILCSHYGEKYPETVDKQTPSPYVYNGDYKLSDAFSGDFHDKIDAKYGALKVNEALLSPTRTYLPLLCRMKKEKIFPEISAIFHNTGGGLTKCLRFGSSIHYVKDNLFPMPPIFQALAKKTEKREMYQTYNCGHRLEILVSSEKIARTMIDLAKEFSIEAKIIGYCESSQKNKLTIKDGAQEYIFGLDK